MPAYNWWVLNSLRISILFLYIQVHRWVKLKLSQSCNEMDSLFESTVFKVNAEISRSLNCPSNMFAVRLFMKLYGIVSGEIIQNFVELYCIYV